MCNIFIYKIIIILKFFVFFVEDINGKNYLKYYNKLEILDVYVLI